MIVVHVGAGRHSKQKKSAYKALINRACDAALQCLESDQTIDASVRAVAASIRVLEDSTLTNAGLGSNLTIDARVETDASIMCGTRSAFGSVSGLEGIKNPIEAALLVLKGDVQGQGELGRIRPMTVTKDSHLFNSLERSNLVTLNQLKKHSKYLKMLNSATVLGNMQDTVGAIAIDSKGNVAAGVSSGGIWLKEPGRLGEAAHFGSGVWADSLGQVAISCTGTGEQIMKALLASRTCMKLKKQKYTTTHVPLVIQKLFNEMESSTKYPKVNVGFILKFRDEVWFAHSTETMVLGCKTRDKFKFKFSENTTKLHIELLF